MHVSPVRHQLIPLQGRLLWQQGKPPLLARAVWHPFTFDDGLAQAVQQFVHRLAPAVK